MNKDLFGDDVVEDLEEEYIPEKIEKPKPWTYMTAVSETKKDILKETPELANFYPAFVVNKGFSYFPDSVLYANDMNMYPDIPAAAQYYYYMSSLRKRQRRSKWWKREPNADLDMVREVYQVRAEVAKQYMKILTEENLQTLRELTDTGEQLGKRKTIPKSKKNK